jgi:hypothetical protein
MTFSMLAIVQEFVVMCSVRSFATADGAAAYGLSGLLDNRPGRGSLGQSQGKDKMRRKGQT